MSHANNHKNGNGKKPKNGNGHKNGKKVGNGKHARQLLPHAESPVTTAFFVTFNGEAIPAEIYNDLKETTAKNLRGRPKEDLADKVDFEQVKRLCVLGFTDEQLGFALGVTERTINRWKEDERFASALKAGKLMADAEAVESLQKLIRGYDYFEETVEKRTFANRPEVTIQRRIKKHVAPNVVAIIFWLKNRLPNEWREKLQIEGTIRKEPENMNIKEVTRELANAVGNLDIAGFEGLRKLLPGIGIAESPGKVNAQEGPHKTDQITQAKTGD